MRAWVALLFVALALAGCASDDDGTDGKGKTGTPVQPAPRPVAVSASGMVKESPWPVPVFDEYYVNDRGAGEPTIAVNHRGVAIYPSIEFDSAIPGMARTVVFRSDNGGKAWDYANPKLPINDPILDGESQPLSLDPYVVADPETGRLFSMDLTLACAQLSWSDDDAKTWTTNSVACGIPVNDHQTLFIGPPVAPFSGTPAYPNVVYYCNNQVADAICTHSFDGGLTFTPTGAQPYLGVNTGVEGGSAGFCGGLHGHGHASFTTGYIYLGKGHCGDPWVAVSEDMGATWTRVLINGASGVDGHEVSISTDSAGNVYAFWLDDQTLPRLSVSMDRGYTWSEAFKVGKPGVTAAKFPSIVAGDEGRIAFLYLATTAPNGTQAGGEELLTQTWEAYVGFSYDATSPDPTIVTTTAHPADDPIMRGACNGRCQVANGGQYDFLDIDIHPVTGQVWVALVDNCNDHPSPDDLPPCNAPTANADSYKEARGAVGVQVGGLPLRTAFDDGSYAAASNFGSR